MKKMIIKLIDSLMYGAWLWLLCVGVLTFIGVEYGSRVYMADFSIVYVMMNLIMSVPSVCLLYLLIKMINVGNIEIVNSRNEGLIVYVWEFFMQFLIIAIMDKVLVGIEISWMQEIIFAVAVVMGYELFHDLKYKVLKFITFKLV